jgi:hypothetical protein
MALKRTELKRSKMARKRRKSKAKTERRETRRLENFEKIMHYRAVCDDVDERDEHTCQFPGCRCKIVEHHHGRYRSHGGQDRIEELVDLCWKHHRGSKESPHQSEYWRRFWESWLEKRYPEYWEKIRTEQKITPRYNKESQGCGYWGEHDNKTAIGV